MRGFIRDRVTEAAEDELARQRALGMRQQAMQQQQASPLGNYRGEQTLESDVCNIYGLIALDGSSNVIGYRPTNAPAGTGPYTQVKGIMRSIGPSGGVITQPRQSTGLYNFTLDEPWFCLLSPGVTFVDNSGNNLTAYIDANVRATNNTLDGSASGSVPGTNSSLPNQTIQIKFRGTTGTLTDPPASSKFWFNAVLKRTGRP